MTEGGVSVTLLLSDFKIHLGKVMPKSVVNTLTLSRKFDLLKEVNKKKVENIVVMLGTNWPEERSAKLIVDCLKKLEEKSGCRVYYVNILPYVDKGKYKNQTAIVLKHNEITQEGFADTSIGYIDAYGIVKGINNYHKFTWDGIHYSKKIYNVVFNEILNIVEKNGLEERTVEKKQVNKKVKKKIKKTDNNVREGQK